MRTCIFVAFLSLLAGRAHAYSSLDGAKDLVSFQGKAVYVHVLGDLEVNTKWLGDKEYFTYGEASRCSAAMSTPQGLRIADMVTLPKDESYLLSNVYEKAAMMSRDRKVIFEFTYLYKGAPLIMRFSCRNQQGSSVSIHEVENALGGKVDFILGQISRR